jgi:hypothetical protein
VKYSLAEVLETLHILIPVRFMEKMKSYKQLDTLSKLNSVSLIFSLVLYPEKLGAFLAHIYKMCEKYGWGEFIS